MTTEKDAAATAAAIPAAVPVAAIAAIAAPANPHEGQGGSYQYDPATGQTTLIQRAGHQTADAAEDGNPDQPRNPAQE